MLFTLFICLFDFICQIEAIVQDVTAQGSISNIDALNIRLENQVWKFSPTSTFKLINEFDHN
jgi:hypothetical protein